MKLKISLISLVVALIGTALVFVSCFMSVYTEESAYDAEILSLNSEYD